MSSPTPSVHAPRADVQPVEHETLDRTITGLVTVLPVLALGVAAWRAWDGLPRPADLAVFALVYNSICHAFGRRSYPTADESRNVGWLALPSLGEAWHNNHHAFPTSACHGLERRQLDPSAMVIGALERCGLAWDVVRVSPDRRSSKALGAAARGSA